MSARKGVTQRARWTLAAATGVLALSGIGYSLARADSASVRGPILLHDVVPVEHVAPPTTEQSSEPKVLPAKLLRGQETAYDSTWIQEMLISPAATPFDSPAEVVPIGPLEPTPTPVPTLVPVEQPAPVTPVPALPPVATAIPPEQDRSPEHGQPISVDSPVDPQPLDPVSVPDPDQGQDDSV
ncbi:MAG: hypothetical protein ACOX2L_00265 [Anaerolineae bacterium]|jgi:hypothetical protein|nr:hypothetical protein [Chloroflexota bacterium]